MEYRRSRQTGGHYFFTVVTHQRQPLLTMPENIERLRAAFRREMEKRMFVIDAIVILPDHLHALWRLPEGDADYSGRWSRIKRHFSAGCVGIRAAQSASRQNKREKPVWQRRFWEHTIRDDEDWRSHMDYIHYNPVKNGYCGAGKSGRGAPSVDGCGRAGIRRNGMQRSRMASRAWNMSETCRLGKTQRAQRGSGGLLGTSLPLLCPTYGGTRNWCCYGGIG